MPTFQYRDATPCYEDHGRGFPLLAFAPGGLTSTMSMWRSPAVPITADDGWHTYAEDHLAPLDHTIDLCDARG